MTKYARPVVVENKDGPQTRMMDVFNPAIYEPRPEWGQTDSDLMDRIFSNNKAAWVAAGVWFVAVPDRVQDGAVHTGSDYSDKASYLNPDGTTAED